MQNKRNASVNMTDEIDQLLPQTQCGKCGHPGCRPYAESIALGEPVNRCPPGGQATVNNIAKLLNIGAPPLDEKYGKEQKYPVVAFIREAECIGCTKCIVACPVDAIVGAAKLMHTVVMGECTGCELCVKPCPVDCIDMQPIKAIAMDHHIGQRYSAITSIKSNHIDGFVHWQNKKLRADHHRSRFLSRQERLAASKQSKPEGASSLIRKNPNLTNIELATSDIIATAKKTHGHKKLKPQQELKKLQRNVSSLTSRFEQAQIRLNKAGKGYYKKHLSLKAAVKEAEYKLDKAQKKLCKFRQKIDQDQNPAPEIVLKSQES